MSETNYEKARAFAEKYGVCNAHCHIYPVKIAEKAVASIGGFYGVEMDFTAGTSESLIADGEPFGVQKYLVCSAATEPEQVEHINSFIMNECAKHSEFIGFGTLHPDYVGGFEEEICRCINGGLKGIKLHPDFQKFYIDSDKALKMYEPLQGRLPVLFHMGDARYDYSAPERLARVMDMFPGLTAIAAHLGGYTTWERAQSCLAGKKNVWYDCSSSLAMLTPDQAAEYIRNLGTDKVFFGTDFPMWNHEGELIRFERLPLSENERKAVLSENFKRFFGLD